MALIDRAAALALINNQNSSEVIETAARSSAALATFRTVQMSTRQARMPVIDVLPSAGFLASDNTAKPTTAQVWADKTLIAEEVACIVPIPENVFDDTAFDVWANVRPRIAEAIGQTLDRAVFFGGGKPTSWPDSLLTGSVAAGNTVSAAANAGDLAADFNEAISLVEADGFDPDTIWSSRRLRGRLRGLRDANGMPIYNPSLRDGTVDNLYGINIAWVNNGAWTEPVADADPVTAGDQPAGAHAIVGDSNMAIIGVRQDIDYRILTEATVGGFNLAEQDMIALRAKARFAFQVADPTTIEGGSAAYPFAAVRA